MPLLLLFIAASAAPLLEIPDAETPHPQASAEHAEANPSPRTGEFCEIVGTTRLRVSCFTVTRESTLALTGTAYARGSAFATWTLSEVVADSGTALVYRYAAEMGSSVGGISHLTLPEGETRGGGWYQTDGGHRVPFVVVTRAQLEACAGDRPEHATSAQLASCLL
ncbi:MAG: hypothetical protein KC912_25000 [Proteobacteria bacterium]|nr:hypothetical protein [Pseudomonadota bacterium]